MIALTGFCPMGCGQTLVTTSHGHVRCSRISCPNPRAVDIILEDQETEHLVTFERYDFKIKHPLRERIGDELLNCQLHTDIAAFDGPPVKPGTYRVHDTSTIDESAPAWTYTALAE